MDASSSCASTAVQALTAKLSYIMRYIDAGKLVLDVPPDTAPYFTNPFNQWLAGAAVTNMFAAAWRLQTKGLITTELDNLLIRVRQIYAGIPVPQDRGSGTTSKPGCGRACNTCFDDFALTASGFGWVAAYEKVRGRSATTYANRAKDLITQSITPMSANGPLGIKGGVCFYKQTNCDPALFDCRCDPNGGPAQANCFGTLADLDTGAAKIIGAEHSIENPAYGFGLMASIASACKGLEIAGQKYDFSPFERRIVAYGLIKHAQEKALPNGSSFNNNCINLNTGATISCADFGYIPSQFPLKQFYRANNLDPSNCDGKYSFNNYNDPRADQSSCRRHDFWGRGRQVVYGMLAFDLWSGNLIGTNYQGTLDSADCFAGVQGWGYDRNNPNATLSVQITVDATSNLTSANLFRGDLVPACIGNGKHAFNYPSSTTLFDGQPHTIRARISGATADLPGSPKTMTCGLRYEGYNDGANCSSIWGWAWDRNLPNTALNVDLYESKADGTLSYLGTTSANLFRQDLLNAGKGNGFHAFTFNIPASLKNGLSHTLRVKIGGTQVDLGFTPRTIQSCF